MCIELCSVDNPCLSKGEVQCKPHILPSEDVCEVGVDQKEIIIQEEIAII